MFMQFFCKGGLTGLYPMKYTDRQTDRIKLSLLLCQGGALCLRVFRGRDVPLFYMSFGQEI